MTTKIGPNISCNGLLTDGTKQLTEPVLTNTLHWRHNELDGVSNHRRPDCLFNRFFRRISKKTSKLRVIDLCEGNSPVAGEFPAQRANNAEKVSIWWRHHDEGLEWLCFLMGPCILLLLGVT